VIISSRADFPRGRHFGVTPALSAYSASRYPAAAAAAALAVGRRVAPPATNRRTRAASSRSVRSDSRHKTANLPTNDCFCAEHVIRFRVGEIAARCAAPPQSPPARHAQLPLGKLRYDPANDCSRRSRPTDRIPCIRSYTACCQPVGRDKACGSRTAMWLTAWVPNERRHRCSAPR